MLLSKVAIKNYRCFADVEVDLDKTTVIIGENNSGKTSFLEAIRTCLSRSATRQSGVFDDYDRHLPSAAAQLNQSGDLSIKLCFVLGEDTSEEVVQGLSEAIVFDDHGTQRINLEVTSKFEPAIKDFINDWYFLDDTGKPLGPKAKKPQLLGTLCQFSPLFYLSALRDATKEFQARSPFWSPFLKNTNISEEDRVRVQNSLNELNSEVLKTHASLAAVKDRLAKVQHVVSSGNAGAVDIEALPGRITDLLSRTQINIVGSTGASLPLNRHGAGTQSLAVIFLFEAFAATMLAEQYDPQSRPLLALEEPEAHLHPCAIRNLWTALDAIAGQKIIATHSGDLLSKVPLLSVRRFSRENGIVTVRKLEASTLNDEELRKVEFHLRSTRGELLFARCWLLGEGESEYWVFSGVAELIGHDLDRLGIRIVSYQQCGIRSFLKVANSLGIAWFAATDGDQQGQKDKSTCVSLLNGKQPDVHIKLLDQDNIELLLCVEGFGEIFEGYVSDQKRPQITEQPGSLPYWKQVLKARDDTPKPAVLLKVLDEMRSRGVNSIPAALKTVIDSAVLLAESQA